jgi:hypothetical protein
MRVWRDDRYHAHVNRCRYTHYQLRSAVKGCETGEGPLDRRAGDIDSAEIREGVITRMLYLLNARYSCSRGECGAEVQ